MDELEKRGLDQNTVVLFTSDNGHFSGEHGLGGKWLMYEPSLRVPGFLFDPRQPVGNDNRQNGHHDGLFNDDVGTGRTRYPQ